MHNTTYIKPLLAALAIAIAMPLQAQSAPPQGCYERDYSASHLASQPKQVVDKITIRFVPRRGELTMDLLVLTANQGHARKSGLGGQWFKQILYCRNTDGNRICGVECDGGRMEITRNDAKILEFKTKRLLVGETEGCGGAVDLVETQDEFVTYRLQRVADSQCSIK